MTLALDVDVVPGHGRRWLGVPREAGRLAVDALLALRPRTRVVVTVEQRDRLRFAEFVEHTATPSG